MKHKYVFSFTKDFFKSYMFDAIILIFIIGSFLSLTLYSSLGDKYIYINRMNHILLSKSLNISFLASAILLAITYTIKKFNYYDFYFIRFKNKKEYHRFCLLTVISNTTLVYFMYLFFIFFIHLIFKHNVFKIMPNQVIFDIPHIYYVHNFYYMIWCIFKLYIISLIYTVFSYILYRILNHKLSLIINVILLIMIDFSIFPSIFNHQFYLLESFLEHTYFSSFSMEFWIFSLHVLLSILILSFLYEVFIKHMKVISE